MADKLFTDNDLLQEKSYATRIDEKVNPPKEENELLAEKSYERRLTEAIEQGGSAVEFRNIKITNNLTGTALNSFVALAYIVEKDGKINVDNGGFYGHGETRDYKIVAPPLKYSGGRKEQFIYLRARISANAIFTGEHISVLGSIDVDNLRYTLVQINGGSPLDIEITVANG